MIVFFDVLEQTESIVYAVGEDLNIYKAVEVKKPRTTANVMGLLDAVLGQAGKSYDDLQGVVVFKGVGSFTSSRIGVAIANAMGFAMPGLKLLSLDVASREILQGKETMSREAYDEVKELLEKSEGNLKAFYTGEPNIGSKN